MGISTHVLDTAVGRPARGIAVTLSQPDGGQWRTVASGVTDDDGRIKPLIDSIPAVGTYRLTFDVAPYFSRLQQPSFYPCVTIDFSVKATSEHHHVPLLLSPFGFSTYRGS